MPPPTPTSCNGLKHRQNRFKDLSKLVMVEHTIYLDSHGTGTDKTGDYQD